MHRKRYTEHAPVRALRPGIFMPGRSISVGPVLDVFESQVHALPLAVQERRGRGAGVRRRKQQALSARLCVLSGMCPYPSHVYSDDPCTEVGSNTGLSRRLLRNARVLATQRSPDMHTLHLLCQGLLHQGPVLCQERHGLRALHSLCVHRRPLQCTVWCAQRVPGTHAVRLPLTQQRCRQIDAGLFPGHRAFGHSHVRRHHRVFRAGVLCKLLQAAGQSPHAARLGRAHARDQG
jgi:hypothetical protein